MAILRDYVWKRVGSQTKLLPLNTNQAGGYAITELLEGSADTKKIRIVPYKGLASTQDLLHVAEDLIENDRRINNEKNAGHSILSDGAFNDQGANFEIEVVYDAVTEAFKGITIQHGKVKTNSTIYEILEDVEYRLADDIPSPLEIVANSSERGAYNPSIDDYVYQTDESTLYKYNGSTYDIVEVMANPNDIYVITNIPSDNGGNTFRRDYISIVYYDTDKFVGDTLPATPYWRYYVSGNYFDAPVFKNQQKRYTDGVDGELWDASLNKKDSENNPAVYREYIIYSISYEYTEGRTEIDSIEMIPNIVGISDLVHFIDANLTYDSGLYKIGRTNKNFYHPYKTFTPLDPSYGQGESIVKEGYKTQAIEYATNQLMEDYVDFNSVDASLFNFPFKMTEIENDFTLSNSVFIDHILLGYKKEGFWNGDNISIYNPASADHEKLFEMDAGDWSEITGESLHGFGSWIPEVAKEGEYFELIDGDTADGIYLFSNGSWALVDAESILDNTKRVRYGNKLPNNAIINDYFELIGVLNDTNDIDEYVDANKNFPDGLYKYSNTEGALKWIAQTFTEGVVTPTTPTLGDYFKAYGGGTLVAGWYQCTTEAIMNDINPEVIDTPAVWTEIEDVPHGNAFFGGIDRDAEGDIPRWSATPSDGEFFKSDGTSKASKGWYLYIYDQDGFENGYWRKLPIHWGNKLPLTTEFNTNIYFVCNGEESEIEGPAKGLYKFQTDDWTRFIYTIDDTFPAYPNDKDHFYLDTPIGVSYPVGMYRFDKGLWKEITTTVDTIIGEAFDKLSNEFPFNPNSGDNTMISPLTDGVDGIDVLNRLDKLYYGSKHSYYGKSGYSGKEGLAGYYALQGIQAIIGKSGLTIDPAPNDNDYFLLDNGDGTHTLKKYDLDTTTWNNATYNDDDYFLDYTGDVFVAVMQYDATGDVWTDQTPIEDTYIFIKNTAILYLFDQSAGTIASQTFNNGDLFLLSDGYDPARYTLTFLNTDTLSDYSYNYKYTIIKNGIQGYVLYYNNAGSLWIVDSVTDGLIFPVNNFTSYFSKSGTWGAVALTTGDSFLAINDITTIKEIWSFDTIWNLVPYVSGEYYLSEDAAIYTLKKFSTAWITVTPSDALGDKNFYIVNTDDVFSYDGSWLIESYIVDYSYFVSTNKNKLYQKDNASNWGNIASIEDTFALLCIESEQTGFEKLFVFDISENIFNEISFSALTEEQKNEIYFLDYDESASAPDLYKMYDFTGVDSLVKATNWTLYTPSDGTYFYSYINKKIYKYLGTNVDPNNKFTLIGHNLYNKLPITFDNSDGDFFLYHNIDDEYFLYEYNVNDIDGGKFEWDGYVFKSINTDDPTKPKYGWYKYDYFSQLWVPIYASVLDEYPEYNLFDQRYIEGSGDGSLVSDTLYLYDEDQKKWNLITFPASSALFPVSPSYGEYYQISGSTNEAIPDGYYRYFGGYWDYKPVTIVNSVPDLEDDITIKFSKPNIYVSDSNIDNIELSEVTNLSNGSYELKLSTYLANRLYNNLSPKDDFTNGKDISILITSGNGKQQIGKVDNITWSGSGNDYEEVITVSGLYYETITSSQTVLFFNTFEMVDVANSEVTLTKKDLMSDVDKIINYIPIVDTSVDLDILPSQFNDSDEIYEIKFDLGNLEITKNEWYLVRVKSSDAIGSEPTWKNPSIIIGTEGLDTTAYINIRYSTVDGLYPYYGETDEGAIDYNIKYLVIEDIANNQKEEVQTPSLYRKEKLGFEKFKVIAKNLDDTNSARLLQELAQKTKQNEIYFDVINGRIMFHPEITAKIEANNNNYNFVASFIILNTLTGYLTSDNIIHQEQASETNQKLLYSKIKEMEEMFIKEFNTAVGRKIFNYRGKYSKLWIDPNNNFKAKFLENDTHLTDGLGFQENEENTNHPYFFSYSDGQPVSSLYNIEAVNPLPRLMEGDEYIKNLFIFDEGFCKSGDYIKYNSVWYIYNGITWTAIPITYEQSTEPEVIVLGTYYWVNTSELDGENLYISGDLAWNPVSYAYKNGFELPTKKYVENNILLTSTPDKPLIRNNYFKFSTIGDIESQIEKLKYLGLLFKKNVNWDFENILVKIYRSEDDALLGTATQSYANIVSIVEANDLVNKDKFVYFDFNDLALETGKEYFFHVYYDTGVVGEAPIVLGYDDGTGNSKGFMKILCLPFAGQGYSNNIFDFLNISNSSLAFEINSDLSAVSHGIDATTNLPVVEGGNNPIYNIVIPVDFSDDNIWENWNYGECIGVDMKLGRIKFPKNISVDITTLSAEFNINWLNSYITSKAISVSLNDNASIEDVYKITDIYNNDLQNYIEEQIAKYSPQEVVYISTTGDTTEPFLVTFLPDNASGGDAAVKDLMVFVDGEYKKSSSYTITEKELRFNQAIGSGLEVCIKGRDYKVLTTVSNGTITPDHFSDATQQLMQELQDIRDVDVPKIISDARQDFSILIETKINEALIPKENIFQFDSVGGFIQRYNFDTDAWDNVASTATFNNLVLTWKPYDKSSLMVYVSGAIQSSKTFELSGNNNEVISFDDDLENEDLIVIKGNVVRPAQAPTITVEPVEDIFEITTAPQSVFTCDFLAKSKTNIMVFIGGMFQSGNEFTLTNTSTPAKIIGDVDLSAGHDFTISDPFEISVNGNPYESIQLDANCANLTAIIDEINTKLTSAGLNTSLVAVADTGMYVSFETVYPDDSNPYGSRTKIQLKHSFVSETVFGFTFPTVDDVVSDVGEDGVSIITFGEDINVGETVVVKGGAITEQAIPDGRIEHYHLNPDLQNRLNL